MNETSSMRDIIERVQQWRALGEEVAIATVLTTTGSTPRPLGAKLAITARGDIVGSISGGCVDTDVVEHALQVLRTGRPQILEYGYTPDMSWEIGLMCGGSVEVYIERLEAQPAGSLDTGCPGGPAQELGEPGCRT